MNKKPLHYQTIIPFMLAVLGVSVAAETTAQSAGIKLPQTRVIFNSKDKSALATIQNQGDNVYLVKASVLADTDSGSSIAPFAVTPPLFRLEPRNQQTVRIVRQGTSSLPTDRESIFYLSFLAIPSITQANADENRLAIGLQTVIKLFYRPDRLGMTAEQAAAKLVFRQQDKQITAENPTPYYLTLGTLKVAGKAINFPATGQGQMLAPFSQQHYSTDGVTGSITWTVINDYGGLSAPYQTTNLVVKGER